MKKGFLLSLLVILAVSYFLHGQEPRVVRMEKEWKEIDFHPQIAGYFNGAIPQDVICDVRGLITNVGYKIITYDLLYFNGLTNIDIHIIGNTIPDTICAVLKSFGSNNEIFFTNIKAMDLDGRIMHLSPLKLTAILED
jgi:hypothetical protein